MKCVVGGHGVAQRLTGGSARDAERSDGGMSDGAHAVLECHGLRKRFGDFLAVNDGGTPTEPADIRDLMRLMIPAMRADLRASRRDLPDARPLTCPIRAYGGSDDSLASPRWLARWSPTQRFSLRTFAGGHFYLTSNSRALVQDIASNLWIDTWQATA
jgi:surfactin synthase thioesterase subunit